MKKVLIIAGILAVTSLTSCKKDYECKDSDNDVVGQCLDCSSSDAEDLESALNLLWDDVSCSEK